MIHQDYKAMLQESLKEYLYVAKACVEYRKDDEWPKVQKDGCLGYPGALMLLSIADTIGAAFEGDKKFTVLVAGQEECIQNGGEDHFKILNSKYFDLQLQEDVIAAIYKGFRNLLAHQSVLGKDVMLWSGDWKPYMKERFGLDQSHAGFALIKLSNGVLLLNLFAMLRVCEKSVELFLNDLTSGRITLGHRFNT